MHSTVVVVLVAKAHVTLFLLVFHYLLTLPVPIPDENRKLISLIFFIFTIFCGASKGFVKV